MSPLRRVLVRLESREQNSVIIITRHFDSISMTISQSWKQSHEQPDNREVWIGRAEHGNVGFCVESTVVETVESVM